MPDVKFCGLTRAEDAVMAAQLGAAYAGVIFAGGPRALDAARAREVLDGAVGVQRVGVFGPLPAEEIGKTASAARLDVVQLHADPSVNDVLAVREATGFTVWAALRISGATLPAVAAELADVADGLLLDARVSGRLGGTGTTLDWERLVVPRGRARVILAGGLTPDNVARAVAVLRPDVVDVSSGVERSAGVKDHRLMRRFVFAARQGSLS